MRQAIQIPVSACLMMVALLVLSAATSADPPQEPSEKATAAEEEQYRREAERLVSGIELEMLVDEKWSGVKRIAKPLLFYGDPTRGHTRGSVWAWGETGRPVAPWNSGKTVIIGRSGSLAYVIRRQGNCVRNARAIPGGGRMTPPSN